MQPSPINPAIQPGQNGLSEGSNVWTWPPLSMLPPPASPPTAVPDVEVAKAASTNGVLAHPTVPAGGSPAPVRGSPLASPSSPSSVRVASPVKIVSKPGDVMPTQPAAKKLASPPTPPKASPFLPLKATASNLGSPVTIGVKSAIPTQPSPRGRGSPVRIDAQRFPLVTAPSIAQTGTRVVGESAAAKDTKIGGAVSVAANVSRPVVMSPGQMFRRQMSPRQMSPLQNGYRPVAVPQVGPASPTQGTKSAPAASSTAPQSTSLAKEQELANCQKDLHQLEEENTVLRTLMTTLSFFRDARTTSSVQEVEDDTNSTLAPEIKLQQRLQRKRQCLVELEGRKLRGEELLVRVDVLLTRMRSTHSSLEVEIESLRRDLLAGSTEPRRSDVAEDRNLQSRHKSFPQLRQMPSSSSAVLSSRSGSSASAVKDALHVSYSGDALYVSSPHESQKSLVAAVTGVVGRNLNDSPNSLTRYPDESTYAEPHTPEPPWGKDQNCN